MSRIVRAASRDDSRPILQAVYLKAENGTLAVAATDSYRLAWTEIDVGEECPDAEVLAPAKGLADVLSTMNGDAAVALSFGDRHLGVFGNDVWATTRLIEGQFPNYKQLIPDAKPAAMLTADTDALKDAVARTATLLAPGAPLKLILEGKKARLEAVSPDRGSARHELDAKCTGEIQVAFNPAYVLDGLAVVGGSKVTIQLHDAIKPAVFEAEGSPYRYIVMPVRIPQAAP